MSSRGDGKRRRVVKGGRERKPSTAKCEGHAAAASPGGFFKFQIGADQASYDNIYTALGNAFSENDTTREWSRLKKAAG